jgi:hypothetical protein
MSESINNSTEIKKKKKRQSPSFDPDCQFSYKQNVISEAQINNLSDSIVKWVRDNPEAKTITEFILSKGLRRQTFNALLSKHPQLADSYEVAMTLLGERLWGNAVDRKADWKAVHWNLHNYSEYFKANYIFHKEMSKDEEKLHGDRYILLPAMPETSVVKTRE